MNAANFATRAAKGKGVSAKRGSQVTSANEVSSKQGRSKKDKVKRQKAGRTK